MTVESALQELKESDLTQAAIKATGLTFEQLQEVQLYPECWMPENPGGWGLSWPGMLIKPKDIPTVQPFAVLKWLMLSEEAWKDEYRIVRAAANQYIVQQLFALQYLKGQKQIAGSYAGADAQWEQKRKEWPEYQVFLDDLLKRCPNLSLTDARKRTAKHFSISYSTVKKRTKRPEWMQKVG